MFYSMSMEFGCIMQLSLSWDYIAIQTEGVLTTLLFKQGRYCGSEQMHFYEHDPF